MKLFERIKAWFIKEFNVPVADVPHVFRVGDRVIAYDPGYGWGHQEGVITGRISDRAFYVRLPNVSMPVPQYKSSPGWTFVYSELTPLL